MKSTLRVAMVLLLVGVVGVQAASRSKKRPVRKSGTSYSCDDVLSGAKTLPTDKTGFVPRASCARYAVLKGEYAKAYELMMPLFALKPSDPAYPDTQLNIKDIVVLRLKDGAQALLEEFELPDIYAAIVVQDTGRDPKTGKSIGRGGYLLPEGLKEAVMKYVAKPSVTEQLKERVKQEERRAEVAQDVAQKAQVKAQEERKKQQVAEQQASRAKNDPERQAAEQRAQQAEARALAAERVAEEVRKKAQKEIEEARQTAINAVTKAEELADKRVQAIEADAQVALRNAREQNALREGASEETIAQLRRELAQARSNAQQASSEHQQAQQAAVVAVKDSNEESADSDEAIGKLLEDAYEAGLSVPASAQEAAKPAPEIEEVSVVTEGAAALIAAQPEVFSPEPAAEELGIAQGRTAEERQRIQRIANDLKGLSVQVLDKEVQYFAINTLLNTLFFAGLTSPMDEGLMMCGALVESIKSGKGIKELVQMIDAVTEFKANEAIYMRYVKGQVTKVVYTGQAGQHAEGSLQVTRTVDALKNTWNLQGAEAYLQKSRRAVLTEWLGLVPAANIMEQIAVELHELGSKVSQGALLQARQYLSGKKPFPGIIGRYVATDIVLKLRELRNLPKAEVAEATAELRALLIDEKLLAEYESDKSPMGREALLSSVVRWETLEDKREELKDLGYLIGVVAANKISQGNPMLRKVLIGAAIAGGIAGVTLMVAYIGRESSQLGKISNLVFGDAFKAGQLLGDGGKSVLDTLGSVGQSLAAWTKSIGIRSKTAIGDTYTNIINGARSIAAGVTGNEYQKIALMQGASMREGYAASVEYKTLTERFIAVLSRLRSAVGWKSELEKNRDAIISVGTVISGAVAGASSVPQGDIAGLAIPAIGMPSGEVPSEIPAVEAAASPWSESFSVE